MSETQVDSWKDFLELVGQGKDLPMHVLPTGLQNALVPDSAEEEAPQYANPELDLPDGSRFKMQWQQLFVDDLANDVDLRELYVPSVTATAEDLFHNVYVKPSDMFGNHTPIRPTHSTIQALLKTNPFDFHCFSYEDWRQWQSSVRTLPEWITDALHVGKMLQNSLSTGLGDYLLRHVLRDCWMKKDVCLELVPIVVSESSLATMTQPDFARFLVALDLRKYDQSRGAAIEIEIAVAFQKQKRKGVALEVS